MNTIRVAVQVPLAAAVAAGQDKYGETSVALWTQDISRLSDRGKRYLSEASRRGDGTLAIGGHLLSVPIVHPDQVIAAIEAYAAAQEAEHERRVAELLARPSSDWITVASDGRPYLRDMSYDSKITSDPRVVARREEVEQIELQPKLECWQAEQRQKHERKIDAIRRTGIDGALIRCGDRWQSSFERDRPERRALLREALGDDVYQRADDEAKRRNAALDEADRERDSLLVSLHGSASQRARLAEGVLPRKEIQELFESVAMSPFAGCCPYERIKRSEVQHDDGCDCEHEYDSGVDDDPAEIPERPYEALVAMRARITDSASALAEALPGASAACALRQHWLRCERCNKEAVHWALMVSVLWRGRLVSREYRA